MLGSEKEVLEAVDFHERWDCWDVQISNNP
jgi:hypothetical protein